MGPLFRLGFVPSSFRRASSRQPPPKSVQLNAGETACYRRPPFFSLRPRGRATPALGCRARSLCRCALSRARCRSAPVAAAHAARIPARSQWASGRPVVAAHGGVKSAAFSCCDLARRRLLPRKDDRAERGRNPALRNARFHRRLPDARKRRSEPTRHRSRSGCARGFTGTTPTRTYEAAEAEGLNGRRRDRDVLHVPYARNGHRLCLRV